MIKRGLSLLVASLLGIAFAGASEKHPANGIVLQVDLAHRSMVISCEAIPGYMEAMEMPFRVTQPGVLQSLKPGSTVRFTIVERGKAMYADKVRQVSAHNFEAEPMEAGNLAILDRALGQPAARNVLAVGQEVPDFALTDQAGAEVHLAQFEGKVVALTFGYSRCPNPSYCFRLSNNLARVGEHFHARAGRDLVLMTVMIDPEHDRGEVLSQYAAAWKADPAVWHFLTGPLQEVKLVAGMFGMNFWGNEGLVTHSLRTVVIDRQGRLAANLEGNQFTSQQLGDLVATVMNRPH
jgi:protein SCO1